MGAFNSIYDDFKCPVCDQTGRFEVQFKYGDCWQYIYQIGEKIKWGGNDKGIPGCEEVIIEAIGGPCPNCGEQYIEFDLLLKKDRIISITPIGTERPHETKEGYIIVKK